MVEVGIAIGCLSLVAAMIISYNIEKKRKRKAT